MRADFLHGDQHRSGIYSIVNFERGVAYIGSAVDFLKRFNQHRNELRKNIHANKKLQNCYNKYGEGELYFNVLEFVEDRSKLLAAEQIWIDRAAVAKHKFLNICLVAGNTLGVRPSLETRAKMSLAGRGKKRGPQSPSHKAANAATKLGIKRGPQSSEDRAKKSLALRGNKNALGAVRSPETRARMSVAQKKRFSDARR